MAKKWYRLDTAALIFPAIARRNWCNVFRVSATLKEPVDTAVLQQALDDLRPRFPSFFVCLRQCFFWYYLEETTEPVRVREDYAYPLTFMSRKELRRSCLRVFSYKNRIAVEFFHSLTDGHGGSVFLSSLVARYLELKGVTIPRGPFVRGAEDPPTREELEDSFFTYAGDFSEKRDDSVAYHLDGTAERDGFKHLTTGIVETQTLLDLAHRYKVSVTVFLAAVMAKSVIEIQDAEFPKRWQKPVKISLPVDLRRLFGSDTLRNFSLVLHIGVDPRLGEYSLEDLCKSISHQLAAGATRQHMAGMIAANVEPQRIVALRLAPLVLKNFVMDLVYRKGGESGGSLNISNLGALTLPEAMEEAVERVEFIIGPQRSYPNNCSVISFGGKTCINMIRSIRESELERRFFSTLVELGAAVSIESNRR